MLLGEGLYLLLLYLNFFLPPPEDAKTRERRCKDKGAKRGSC